MSRALSTIEPASASRMPATRRSRVVLPQPEGPSSVKNSPGFTSRLTPSTAAVAPKCFASPATLRPMVTSRPRSLCLQHLALEARDPGGPLGVHVVVVDLVHLHDVVGRDLL